MGRQRPTSGISPWSPLAGGRRCMTGRACPEHELARGSLARGGGRPRLRLQQCWEAISTVTIRKETPSSPASGFQRQRHGRDTQVTCWVLVCLEHSGSSREDRRKSSACLAQPLAPDPGAACLQGTHAVCASGPEQAGPWRENAFPGISSTQEFSQVREAAEPGQSSLEHDW